jgi:hypothetical protein
VWHLARRLTTLFRQNWPLAAVLGFGAGLRVAVEIAYWPALYYPDSWAYIAQANGSLFSNPAQPAGYPVMIRILRSAGLHLGVLTSLQHVAGLLAALGVYLIALRGTGSRSLATIGAAVVVLDGYALAIEQYVMTDALFGLMLVVVAAGSLLSERRLAHIASGLLLALACLVRPVGMFCIPVWLGYMLWRHRLGSTILLCCAAVLAPIAGYAADNDAHTGHFGVTEDTDWLLYARVAGFGSCTGLDLPAAERPLCPRGRQVGQASAFYMYSRDSPAVQAFGLPSTTAPPRVDRLLRGYALRVISQQPLDYAGAVAGDFGAFFVPRAPSDLPLADRPITLPSSQARAPGLAAMLRTYARILHTVRPLLAMFLIAGLLALFIGAARSRPTILLLQGMGVALMVGAALSHFELRYALPSVPLLTAGGLVAAGGLWRAAAAPKASSGEAPDAPAEDARQPLLSSRHQR